MGFKLNKGGNFTLCPAGTHIARCHMVIDMGTHNETFEGKSLGPKRKVRIGFEFPTETHVFDEKKGAEPFTMSRKLTNSLHEKSALSPMLTAWRGRPFTSDEIATFGIDDLLGAPALVSVTHEKKTDGKVIAKISSVTKLVKGMKCPPAVLPTILFSVDQGPNDPTFQSLPEWIREEISECNEWSQAPDVDTDQGEAGDAPSQDNPEEDDVPF